MLGGLAVNPLLQTCPASPHVFTTGMRSTLQHSKALHVAPLQTGAGCFSFVPMGHMEAEQVATDVGAGASLQHSWVVHAAPVHATAAGFLGRIVPAGQLKPVQVGTGSQQDLGVQVLAWGQMMFAALSLSLDLTPHLKFAQFGLGLQHSACEQEEPRQVMPVAFILRWLPTGHL